MKMKRGMRSLMGAGFLAVLGLASVTRAPGEVIPVDRVPRAVMDAAKARFPGAKIQQASEETEDGTTVYSLAMKHQRHDLDVTFKGDGTVVLAETDVPAKEWPKEVRRAVERRYPGASVRGAASVRKGPGVKKQADYYEFYLWTADQKPGLVKVDPKGKVLEDPYRRVLRARPRPPMSRSPGPVAR
jgi:hypothetical protein